MLRRRAFQLLLSTPVLISLTASIAAGQPPASSRTEIPEWQRAAGGHMQFEVASVREDPSGRYVAPPFSLDSDDDFKPDGGLFEADGTVTGYIAFAYKLNQLHPMIAHLPPWASKVHFEIKARGAADATKDQLRLMMQSLLADRFKLALHFEPQMTPVLIMTELKQGKLGPRLRMHADGPACDAVRPHVANSDVTLDMFPCNSFMAVDKPEHVIMAGARNTTMPLIGAFFCNVEKTPPILDRTGIAGTVDFSMEWTPQRKHPPGQDDSADIPGTTFLEAVKTQLGLELQPSKAVLDIPVIDQMEMPSEN